MAQLDDHSYIRNIALNSINAKFDENVDINAILHAVKEYKNTSFDGPLMGALNLYDDFVNKQRQMINEEMADNPNYNVVDLKGDNKNG
jgi:hypothetical protein